MIKQNQFTEQFAKLKTAVADMAFTADEPDALSRLCRIGNMAYLRQGRDGRAVRAVRQSLATVFRLKKRARGLSERLKGIPRTF